MPEDTKPVDTQIPVDNGPEVDNEIPSGVSRMINSVTEEKPAETETITETSTPTDGGTVDKVEVKIEPTAEQPKRKYADTFETVEELEKGYRESSKEGIENARKLKQGLPLAKKGALIDQDPELREIYERKYGENAQQQFATDQKDQTKKLTPEEIKFQEAVKLEADRVVKQELDQRLGPIEKERYENQMKSYQGELDAFEQEHTEFSTLPDEEKARVGELAYNFCQTFPKDSLKKNMERAWREYDIEAIKTEAKQEAYAEVHKNNLSSVPTTSGGSGDAPSGRSVAPLDELEAKVAKSFNMSAEEYRKWQTAS